MEIKKLDPVQWRGYGFTARYQTGGCWDIVPVEEALADAFPGCPVYRAFTSGVVRRRLREIYRLMHDIVSVCHETCHLGSLKNGDVYYLKKVESPLYSHTVTVEGRSLPAYATGVGKALLADYQLPQLKALYYDGLYPLTEHTITDFRLLADQLAEIRASGFAYECEESTRGIRCIGVPLRKSGKVVAALSVAFPLERYSDAAAASARQALDEARRQIERMLCSVELQF